MAKRNVSKPVRIRQGDVLLYEIDRLPKGVKVHKENILARGEVTGHEHVILDGTVYVDESGQLYVDATEKEATIAHIDQAKRKANHEPITLPKKLYRAVIQREYEPDTWRYVAD